MMEHTNKYCKLATWNLCLGLMNKKDIVSRIIMEEEIDICVLQEIDVPPDIDAGLLSFKGYSLLIDNNHVKARTGIYIKNKKTPCDTFR